MLNYDIKVMLSLIISPTTAIISIVHNALMSVIVMINSPHTWVACIAADILYVSSRDPRLASSLSVCSDAQTAVDE